MPALEQVHWCVCGGLKGTCDYGLQKAAMAQQVDSKALNQSLVVLLEGGEGEEMEDVLVDGVPGAKGDQASSFLNLPQSAPMRGVNGWRSGFGGMNVLYTLNSSHRRVPSVLNRRNRNSLYGANLTR